MRRVIVYLVITISTFALGILTYAFWFAPNASLFQRDPLSVSACELEREPQRFDGKFIRVRAILYSDVGGPYLNDPQCGAGNFPLVDLQNFGGLSPELRDWVQSIGRINAPGEGMEAEVLVTGIFDSSYSESSDSTDHRFRITPQEIEQLTPLSRRR